jgi:hypothetical protein
VLSRLRLILLVASCMVSLAGCGGPTRSVAAYCSFFYGQGGQLRQRWMQLGSGATQNPIGALGSVFGAVPEAASFLHELSLRAPDDIAPDVQTLASALEQFSGQAGSAAADPLGALASGLTTGLATGGAEERVNAYTEEHCGGVPGGTDGLSP